MSQASRSWIWKGRDLSKLCLHRVTCIEKDISRHPTKNGPWEGRDCQPSQILLRPHRRNSCPETRRHQDLERVSSTHGKQHLKGSASHSTHFLPSHWNLESPLFQPTREGILVHGWQVSGLIQVATQMVAVPIFTQEETEMSCDE